MSVARAVAIFSPQVPSVLRFLENHGRQLGARGFDRCFPTIEFMKLVYKWFTLQNFKSTLFWLSKDPLRMPFYGPDDERYQRGQRDRLRWEGNKTCPPQAAPVATPEKDIKKLLLPHLVALENYPSPPHQSLRTSTLGLIDGFCIRAVQDNVSCEG
ncbi:hypothetical protein HPB49_005426 [Dermacentor silvarum]|uniref:Uncharacterized protein n=1 Tax=Dermacentor silvarum TaxID=543639 RepID=A0ACB8D343_DERSI|nr:hypothetical protein HPB49_005426 [Dermacentor silvarum]